jgi:hypothetical protein
VFFRRPSAAGSYRAGRAFDLCPHEEKVMYDLAAIAIAAACFAFTFVLLWVLGRV